MRRRRKSRKIRSTSVIYITTIISLGLMGVGYGFWNDGLDINVNITTGNVKRSFINDITRYGDLELDVTDDGKMLTFSGKVYPDFNENIEIKIEDTGTVPLVLDKVEEISMSDIAELNQQKKARYGLFSFFKDDLIETFNLKIDPPEEENDEVIRVSKFSSMDFEEDDPIQRKINRLYDEIRELEEELERYDNIEQHEFRYELQFIQGI